MAFTCDLPTVGAPTSDRELFVADDHAPLNPSFGFEASHKLASRAAAMVQARVLVVRLVSPSKPPGLSATVILIALGPSAYAYKHSLYS